MDMSNEEPDNKRARSAQQDGDDLLKGLESILADEGISLDATEEDIDSLLGDDDPADEDPINSPASRNRTPNRSTHSDRRNRDRAAFNNVYAQMQTTALSIEISSDQLTATLTRITSTTKYEDIIRFIRSENIQTGIDYEGIRSAVHSAHRSQLVENLVVARGRSTKVLREASISYLLPPETMNKRNVSDKLTDFELLKHVLESPHIEAIRSYRGVVWPVKPGDIISRINPAEIEIGENIYGEPIELNSDEEVYLPLGDNTDLSDDGLTCVATIYGYAGLIDGAPTVLPPIWISPDGMVANFVYIAPPEGVRQPVPSVEEILFLLEIMWVTSGLMEKQIQLIQQRLERAHPLPSTLPIAEGIHAVAGDDAQIHYAFDTYSVPSWNQIESLISMSSAGEISNALDEIFSDHSASTFTAVVTGQTVMEKSPASEGLAGQTIRGEEILPKPGDDLPLEVGSNLSIDENGLRCRAEYFGFLSLKWDVQVMLLSPIWVTPDKTCAYFLNFPQGATPVYPKLEEIQELLYQQGINFGFNPDHWVEKRAALSRGEVEDHLILLAQGNPAETGRDASFQWEVNVQDEKKIGKFLDDGSIDFRERDLITLVQENDIIGRLIPPMAGKSGRDVYGNELPPPPQINIEVTIDARIFAETEEEGVIAFFASAAGGVSMRTKEKEKDGRISQRIDISVNPISKISGNVDYTTGNVEFNGDVMIEGSVQQQFSVRATGSVTIGGYIEAGAYVTAGKNIVVKRGVIGASTELIAGGSIAAKYVQEATLRSGSDIRIGSHLFNASVRSGGQIVVTGKGEGKSRALVGGLAWGARGILARSIGSPYNTNTRLVTGVNPESLERIEQIRANIHSCNQKQINLLSIIGVSSVDVSLIKQKLSYCRTNEEKQKILSTVKRIAKIAELVKSLEEELEEIADSQRRLSLQSSINVQGKLFSGVELRIGELTHSIIEDEQRIGYRLVQEEDEQEIQAGPYKAR